MEVFSSWFTILVLLANPNYSFTTGLVSTPSKQKTFSPVMSPELGDVGLCSVEQPSKVLKISDILLQIEMLGLLTMIPTIPIYVLCADHCSAEQGCTGFNYKQDVGQCQLYNNVPTSCTVQQSCVHYSMNWTNACQEADFRCNISALAWGYNDTAPHNGYISISGKTTSTQTTNGRGFNIVELDVSKCEMSPVHNFDTWASTNNSVNMANYISGLPTSTVLIGVTADEPSRELESNGKNALLSIGVNVTGLHYGGKVAFVAQVGQQSLTVVMELGPTGGDNVKIEVNVVEDNSKSVIS